MKAGFINHNEQDADSNCLVLYPQQKRWTFHGDPQVWDSQGTLSGGKDELKSNLLTEYTSGRPRSQLSFAHPLWIQTSFWQFRLRKDPAQQLLRKAMKRTKKIRKKDVKHVLTDQAAHTARCFVSQQRWKLVTASLFLISYLPNDQRLSETESTFLMTKKRATPIKHDKNVSCS